MPKLSKKELGKLLDDWSIIARTTLDCSTCDGFYAKPYEWFSEKEKAEFIDHLFTSHVHPRPKGKRKK